MFFILLNIFCSVLLLSIFKLFDKWNVNSFHAIVFNYFAATVTGLLFAKNSFDFHVLIHSSWIYLCIPLGVFLITVFYLISLTTRKISISTAAIANKMSVVMPVLFSVLILKDAITLIKITGIVLALVALYVSSYSKSASGVTNKQYIFLPVLVFFGSGLIDVGLNAAKAFYIRTGQDSEMFTTSAFAIAFVIGFCIIMINLFRYIKTKNYILPFLEVKSIAGGILLGIPNYFSIFFIIKALEAEIVSSAQLFPILNISNVILSALTGYLFFKEKLSSRNMIGILIALLAIVLITL